MKNNLLLPALSLGFTLLLTPVRAEDPAPTKLTPEMQELLVQLLKAAAEAKQDPAPVPEPVPQPAAPQPAKAPSPAAVKARLQMSSLTTSGLTTGSLATSGSLGGRGTSGGAARLSEEDWRVLFPAKTAPK